MNITANSSRSFFIKRNHLRLAELTFSSVWSTKARAKLKSGALEIRSESNWGSRYSYWLDGEKRGQMKVNSWSSGAQLSIGWHREEEVSNYSFKQKGVFKPSFLLKDEQGNTLLLLHPRFSWRSFSYKFELEWLDQLPEEQATELVLYAIHAARTIQYRQSG